MDRRAFTEEGRDMARRQLARFARARMTSLVRRWVPDLNDPRYPRPRGQALLRDGAEFSWVLLVLYLANVLAGGMLHVLRRGLASLSSLAAISHLLFLDRAVAALRYSPPLLVSLGAGAMSAILIGRWALEDQARESRVLLLRGLRRPTAGHLAQSLGQIGWRWLRRRVLLAMLVVVCALGGVVLALLNIPDRGVLWTR
jgi:hypothetical protein